MKLIWIRHGETDANREKRYLGHHDVPLNPRGVKQASRLAHIMKGDWPVAVYSSDLTRCRQTAELILTDRKMNLVTLSALRELDFGEWDNQTYQEIYSHCPEQLESWYRDPFTISPPGGETLGQLGQRVDDWIQQVLLTINQNDTVWIISHGGVIRWFMSRWLLGDASQFWQVEGISHGAGLLAEWDGKAWTSTLLRYQLERRT